MVLPLSGILSKRWPHAESQGGFNLILSKTTKHDSHQSTLKLQCWREEMIRQDTTAVSEGSQDTYEEWNSGWSRWGVQTFTKPWMSEERRRSIMIFRVREICSNYRRMMLNSYIIQTKGWEDRWWSVRSMMGSQGQEMFTWRVFRRSCVIWLWI